MKRWILIFTFLPFSLLGAATNTQASTNVELPRFSFDDVMGYTKHKFFVDSSQPGLWGLGYYRTNIINFGYSGLSAGYGDKKHFRFGIGLDRYRPSMPWYLSDKYNPLYRTEIAGFIDMINSAPEISDWNRSIDGPIFVGQGNVQESLRFAIQQESSEFDNVRQSLYSNRLYLNTNYIHYQYDSRYWKGFRLAASNSLRYGIGHSRNLGLDIQIAIMPGAEAFIRSEEVWYRYYYPAYYLSDYRCLIRTNISPGEKTNIISGKCDVFIEDGIRPNWRLKGGLHFEKLALSSLNSSKWSLYIKGVNDFGNWKYDDVWARQPSRFPFQPVLFNKDHVRLNYDLALSLYPGEFGIGAAFRFRWGILEGLTSGVSVDIDQRISSWEYSAAVDSFADISFTTIPVDVLQDIYKRSFFLVPHGNIFLVSKIGYSLPFLFKAGKSRNSAPRPVFYWWYPDFSVGLFNWLNLGLTLDDSFYSYFIQSIYAKVVVSDLVCANISWIVDSSISIDAGFKF